MKKNLMLILIFSLGLFVFCPSVFAYSYPVMSSEQAEYILNHYYENDIDFYCWNNTQISINHSMVQDIIDQVNSQDFASKFNTQLSNLNLDFDISWDDISCFFYKGYTGGTFNDVITFYFTISDKNTNSNLSKLKVSNSAIRSYNEFSSNTNNPLAYRIMLTFKLNESTWLDNALNLSDYTIQSYPKVEEILYSGDQITNFNNILNINQPVIGIYNNEEYSLAGSLITFNNDGSISIPSNPDSPSGDAGTYYNYDYNEYFIRPYIKIETINGLTQYLADSYTIPFSVYSQSGDEYYPFDSLKMDLRVLKSVTDYSGENLETHFVSMVDSYKRYSGNFADTTGFSDFVTNGNILRYNYNLKDKFDSNFVNQYLNDATNKEQYAFQLVLYDFWGDVLSMSDVFYFYDANNLNNKPLIDNWGGDNTINSSFDSTNTADFSSLVKTFTDFMSTIMSFWSFLPGWLIALLTLGVTSAIAIRILGR